MIDNQKSAENVYFLNAVMRSDLLPLRKKVKEPETPAPEPEPKPVPRKKNFEAEKRKRLITPDQARLKRLLPFF